MIIGIVGNPGTGKTLLATLAAVDELENGKEIFANYPIEYTTADGRKAHVIDIGKLYAMLNETGAQFQLHGALLILDEAYAGLDSRVSSSPFSRYISYFLFQSRKLGFDIIFTCQLASSIDKRLKKLADYWIVAEAGADIDEDGEAHDCFNYTMTDPQVTNTMDFQIDEELAKALFPLYQTQKIVKPSEFAGTSKEKKDVVRILLDKMGTEGKGLNKGKPLNMPIESDADGQSDTEDVPGNPEGDRQAGEEPAPQGQSPRRQRRQKGKAAKEEDESLNA